ncbi:MAG: excinuclease ABC subunit UvrC [Spirochaetales bacterium]|nr:excinuclease ABC subunit UvrC [Spirochaetales bacterium]
MMHIVQLIPHNPGVYLMKNPLQEVIYDGKARDLKKRVSSYFLKGRDLKTQLLVKSIADIEYIITTNEYEALILENNLIKKWNPKYNISLKDGKTFPVIRITHAAYPRVFKTRWIIQDGAEYFGPFADVGKLDAYLELIDKLFPLRKCRGLLRKRYSPCLYYHIGRCRGPCTGAVSQEEYQKLVDQVRAFLSGKSDELLKKLKGRMKQASENLAYEKAAEVRDMIAAVESVNTLQKVQDFSFIQRDYAACAMQDQNCSISLFQMEEGKLLGREMFSSETFSEESEALTGFIMQFYTDADSIPRELYISHDVDKELLQTYFEKEFSAHVKIHRPQQGRHHKIIRMAMENASQDVLKKSRGKQNLLGLQELQKVLHLEKLPRRIEGFDIAQLSGKYPAASLISFYEGIPDKKNYRRFHLKTLQGAIDDYEAIREAVARRYTRVINEKLEQPDLIMVDGGAGQVNAAKEILETLGLYHIPVVGLAKEFEEIHTSGKDKPLRLPAGHEGLRVLQAVRDETHRFATALNKKMREKESKFSLLESVPGVGPVRSKKLMQEFQSLDSLLSADPSRIASKGGIPLNLAKRIVLELGND